MKPTISELEAILLITRDGGVACDAINALTKHAKRGSVAAKTALATYLINGNVMHMRTFACSCLATAVDHADAQFADAFKEGLSDPTIRYWSILGYIKTLGRESYEILITIAGDESIPIEDRSHAVKCLASFSRQQFDRQLPSDPGAWKAGDLRLSEIVAWARGGYQDGQGHTMPNRHPALDKPSSDLERIVCRLDKKLAKERRTVRDATTPSLWLVVADQNDITRIRNRWAMPALYLDFLTRFSPIDVTVHNRRFHNGLQIFGAADLIEAQAGYSFNPVDQEWHDDWPKDYVVVAGHGGDPFVLDLSSSDGEDAQVLTAKHGVGEWRFTQVSVSFSAFLESLAK